MNTNGGFVSGRRLKMFTPDQFTPTHFHSAEDKAKFANQFVKFVNSAFAEENFPKWFYQELSNTFGHIAHFDQARFYATFFTCPADALEFINQSLDYPCYDQPEYTYSNVEKVLQSWMIENGIQKIWIENYWLHDLPSRRQYPVAYIELEVKK